MQMATALASDKGDVHLRRIIVTTTTMAN